MKKKLLCLCAALCLAGAARGDDDFYFQEARRKFLRGSYQEAVTQFHNGLEQDPKNLGEYYHWISRSYYELYSFEQAVRFSELAVLQEPRNAEYHRWLGRAYGKKAEYAGWFAGLRTAGRVRDAFEKAAQLDSSNIAALQDLFEFHLEAPGIAGGDAHRAKELADAIARLDAARGHVARAKYFLKRKQAAKAEASYRKALELKSAHANTYFDIAGFYEARGNAAAMAHAVEAAAIAEPLNPLLWYYRGVARVLGGDKEHTAELLLNTYLTTVPPYSEYPSHASAYEWLGRLYEQQEAYRLAEKSYRAALTLDPERAYAKEALARIEKLH